MIRPYTAKDRAAVEALNVDYYTITHAFDATFAQAVSDGLADIERALSAGTARGWVVTQAGAPKGSLFLTPDGPATARLRLFYVHPTLHRLGHGRALLSAALQAAPHMGFTRLHVSTFTIHPAACALYIRSGFTQTARHPRCAFGHPLEQVDFMRDLSQPTSQSPPDV